MKLAIVIPWFGRELKGGAEQQAWQIASRLARRGHSVEVLTTCCRSHQDDWATNHVPAGEAKEPEGFLIRRFPVDPRDRQSFDRVCGSLLSLERTALKRGISPISTEESAIFTGELIKSRTLLDYLEEKKSAYDWFIFLPYLYGPVLDGVGIVGDRAALQPCLHDEAYAYLPEVSAAFRSAGKILFNSEGERELALRLFGPGLWKKSVLIGEGVEIEGPAPATLGNGATPQQSSERFVLYLGRKDAGKNVPMLVRAFERFRAVRPNSKLQLFLAGNGSVEANGNSGAVRDLGLVGEERKQELLRGCVALFQPSENESFSRVMMEAWMHGKPVAAHGSCLATSVAVQRSGGGWLAKAEEDWAELCVRLDRLPESELLRVGERGRAYAEALANWEKVMERYEQALTPVARDSATNRAKKKRSARAQINQFLPNLSYGDAISNHAIWIRDQLRELGFASTIYARHIDRRVAHECEVFTLDKLHGSHAAIYHHSIGSEITPDVRRFSGSKCLIYHNITPAEFFLPYRPHFAAIVRQGRDDLRKLAADFSMSFGVSSYNACELEEFGFRDPEVLPIAVDPDKWNFNPDEKVMEQMQDGRTNLLFVGRIAPNKKQDDLLLAFQHYLTLDPDARLVLIGKTEADDAYAAHLLKSMRALDLEDAVVIAGMVTNAELAAYYRTADLFWSMSEHEGFCVPLIEAMWFDIPIMAFRSSGIPETLGQAGLMFTKKDDVCLLAGLASLMVRDDGLRQKIIQAQRKRRAFYLPAEIEKVLSQIVGKLLGPVAEGNGE